MSGASSENKFHLDSNSNTPLGSKNEFPHGSLVWAKLSAKDDFWPGMVINSEDSGIQPTTKADCICVFWIGDNRVSWVARKFIEEFSSKFTKNYKVKDRRLKKSIAMAVEIYMEREYNINLASLSNDLIFERMIALVDPKNDNLEIPRCIRLSLKNIRGMNKGDDTDGNTDDEDCADEKYESPSKKQKLTQSQRDEVLAKIKLGEYDINEVCIVCYYPAQQGKHPFFCCGLCPSCKDTYNNSIFRLNFSGLKIFCIICGQLKGIFHSKEDLLWSFCKKCANDLLDASEQDVRCRWKIHLERKQKTKCLLKVNQQWSQNLRKVFYTNCIPEISKPEKLDCKTCTLICTSQPSNIKEYLEMRAVGTEPMKIQIVTLEDLKDRRNEKIISYLQTSTLVIGWSCPIKEKLHTNKDGTICAKNVHCELFFEFYLAIGKVANNVVWFYEMPAAIEPSLRNTVTRFLKYDPFVSKIESKIPENRYRLLWTNVKLKPTELISINKIICDL